MSNIVLRQDDQGRMTVASQLPARLELDLGVVVQYFAISDQWRARTVKLRRASGEPFISGPYRNPVFAVCNLLMQLADYSDADTSLAIEAALNDFLNDKPADEPAKNETPAVS